MKNKFPGQCESCGQHVEAGAGSCHKAGRRWAVRHDNCPAAAPVAACSGCEECDGEGGEWCSSLRMDSNPRNVSHVARFASGAVAYVNKRGRCIDAPCCGCCS